MISIRDTRPTRPPAQLSLVTVAYQGGPERQDRPVQRARAAGSTRPSRSCRRRRSSRRTSTAEEVEQQNTQEMTDSQDDATAAALTELKIPYSDGRRPWPPP